MLTGGSGGGHQKQQMTFTICLRNSLKQPLWHLVLGSFAFVFLLKTRVQKIVRCNSATASPQPTRARVAFKPQSIVDNHTSLKNWCLWAFYAQAHNVQLGQEWGLTRELMQLRTMQPVLTQLTETSGDSKVYNAHASKCNTERRQWDTGQSDHSWYAVATIVPPLWNTISNLWQRRCRTPAIKKPL